MKSVMDHFSGVPFEYGVADCCQFVAACIESSTGKNPMSNLTYKSEGDARRIIAENGDLEGAITSILGEPVDEVVDGGVALLDIDGTQIAGFVSDSMVWAKSERGLTGLPMRFAKVFWRVA